MVDVGVVDDEEDGALVVVVVVVLVLFIEVVVVVEGLRDRGWDGLMIPGRCSSVYCLLGCKVNAKAASATNDDWTDIGLDLEPDSFVGSLIVDWGMSMVRILRPKELVKT